MDQETLKTPRGPMRVLSLLSLALWRGRQHWFLLMMMSAGMVLAVMLVCMVPLLTTVMQTAALRGVLTASPDSAELALHANALGLSSSTLGTGNQFARSIVQDALKQYLAGQPRVEIQTPDFPIGLSAVPTYYDTPVRLDGDALQEAAKHLTLLQGRLPQTASRDVEVALTPETATALHVHVGSTFTLVYTFYTTPISNFVPITNDQIFTKQMKLDVVGIFQVKAGDPFWHGNNFQPEFISRLWHYAALTSNERLLSLFDQMATAHATDTVYFQPGVSANLHWYYNLDQARVSLANLDDLIRRLGAAQNVAAQTNSTIQVAGQPTVQQFDLQSTLLTTGLTQSTLERLRSRFAVENIPVAILAFQLAGLLLFFISVMIELLVERQAMLLAVLKSRGASGGQIFRASMFQCGLLCLLAAGAGPLLAYGAVSFIAQRMGLNAMGVLASNPLQAIFNVRWYALGATGVMLVVMLISLYRASHSFAVTNHRSLWQRLNLDIGAAIIALTGYGMAVYLTNISGLLNVQTQALVSTPVALIAPVFLLLAAVLLFFRFAPVLFRLASRMAARSRGAIALLAVAHLARSTRQSTRMTLLFALTTAFAIFTLIFAASQEQRTVDIAAYQAGADFSGSIPATAKLLPLAQETRLYQGLPGVRAATVGTIDEETAGASYALVPLQVRAVDPGPFAQATIWPSPNAEQRIRSLLAQLVAQRQTALRQGYIPAIVDSLAWNTLNLHPGETFDVHVQSTLVENIRYVALAEVENIPTLNDSTGGDVGANLLSGHMLVDYQTFAAIQKQFRNINPPVNYVWLRTTDNPTMLAHLRGTLQTSDVRLDNLNDRRALLATMQSDPLYLNLVLLLTLGTIAVLLVTLIGNLLASWQSIRARVTQFVVLRVLGTTPWQIVSIAIEEQAVVYLLGLCIGAGFGLLLALTVVPTLVFSNAPASSILSNLSSDEFYRFQQTFPVQVVYPFSLAGVWAALGVIGLLAVGILSFMALRPAMSPVLRVSEVRPPAPVGREEGDVVYPLSRRGTTARWGIRVAFLTLAFGRMRQAWLMLLLTSIGMIAAVMMVCTIPLLSAIMTTAGLRDTLNSSASNSDITLDASTLGLSPQVVRSVQSQLGPYFQQSLRNYVKPSVSFSMQVAGFTFTSPDRQKTSHEINLFAASMDQVASHVTMQEGRLPQQTGDGNSIDALLTPETALKLSVKVGSTMPLDFTYTNQPEGNTILTGTLNLRVVGLFEAKSPGDYLWHGKTFLPDPNEPSVNIYTLLLPSDALLSTLAHIATTSHAPAMFLPYAGELLWDYQLEPTSITYSRIDDLANRLYKLQVAIHKKYANTGNTSSVTKPQQYPYLVEASVYTPVYGAFNILNTLNAYLNRVDVFRIPATTLVLLIGGLILLFIISMADILVEHQVSAIAVLRSRGASSVQILTIMMSQGVSLGLLALLLGPPLAMVVVTLLSHRMLGPQEQDAIAVVIGNPVQALLEVSWYALATFLVIILTVCLVLRRAAHTNVFELRGEATRSRRTAYWHRLGLDGGAAMIAIIAYGLSVYLSNLGNQLDSSTRVLFAAPLSIATSISLLLGCMFLFLRFFPFLLRLGTSWTVRGRGATTTLTLAQMARSPYYAARTTLLLAFAIALTIFTPVFAASQTQRIADVAGYEVGADFSGDIPASATRRPLQKESTLYKSIAGVTSATVAYTADGVSLGNGASIPVQVRAVDAQTYGSTAIWTSGDSSQSLPSLMTNLIKQQQQALYVGMVPAIVDATAQRELALTIGSPFSITINSLPYPILNGVVVATVQHIPGINNSASTSDISPAGILVDYTAYAAMYRINIQINQLPVDPRLPLNHVWLRTSNSPAAIASVRAALKTKGLYLDQLADRYALADDLYNDPLILNLLLFLLLGTITALLLALVGDVFAAWVRVRTRLTQFVVLRALGATPGQVVRMLTWEQIIVHGTAFALGGVFGAMLSLTVIPTLVFTNTSSSGVTSGLSNAQFDMLQDVLPAQIVVPSSLGVVMLALMGIFLFALVIIIGVTLLPSMGRVLRVNED